MAAIDLKNATGAGFFSVDGTFKASTETLPKDFKTAGTVGSNNSFTATSLVGSDGVTDTTSGGWTINLAASTVEGGINVTIGGADDVLTGASAKKNVVSLAASGLKFKGGSNADSIQGEGADAYLNLGEGNDSVMLKGNSAQVLAGAGDDLISIVGTDAKIYTGASSSDSEKGDSVIAAGASEYVDASNAEYAKISVTGANATIKGGSKGNFISVSGAEANIYGGKGNDTLDVASDYAVINLGAGANSLVASGRENVITGGSGMDTVSVSGAADTITTGADADVVSIFGSDAVVDLGAGADSVFVAEKNATITLGAGKDVVSIGSTGATITDYSYGEDHIILGEGKGTVAGTGVTLTSDGMISAEGADVKVAAKNNYYAAQLYAKDNGTGSANYAWGSDTAAVIDLSSQTGSFWVVGSDNEVADTIKGTKSNDSIMAGTGDIVYGGQGNDLVSVAADATNVTVALQTTLTGEDSIANASSSMGFDDTDLTVLVDGTYTASFDGGNSALKLSGKKGSLQINDVTGDKADVRILQNGTVTNTEIIAASKSASLDADAAYIYGVNDTASIALGETDTAYTVDLSNNKAYGDTRTYKNIKKVDATSATGDVFLIGNGESTLVGGAGNSSLFGFGAKADSLVGGSGNDTFFYANGNGRDTISNYHSGDSDGTNTDTIYFLTADLDLSKTRYTKEDGLTFTFGTGSTQKLTIQADLTSSDAANVIYNWKVTGSDETYHSKYGVTGAENNFTYDSSVSLYYGSTGIDTLTLNDSDSGVFIANGEWDGVYLTNVEVIDASNTSGTVNLWGAEGKSSTLYGGSGTSTLFGGFNGGNDVMYGNSFATTTYFFGTGNGKDTIASSSSSDKVLLYDLDEGSIDYVKTQNQSSGSDLTIVLNDGSKLTVTDVASGVNTFEFSNGNTYSWNTDTKLFEVKN
jgi:Ca2+-binding RTX toxin-like protein